MATRVAPSTEADRAVDTSERVRYLRKEMGLSETDLSDATGASTRTVRRWLAGDVERQRPRFAQQIDDLRAIVDELTESLTAKGIRQWLHSRNRYLRGARPIDMLREGEFEKVREAAHAFNEGYYL